MEVRNCVKCKKIFQYLSGPPLCPSCKEQDEKDYLRVRDYLKENPRATMTEVAEILEISVDRITRYLKEGRLEIAPGSAISLQCESCGTSITTGRYCGNCSGRLHNDFESTSKDLRNRDSQARQSLMKYLKKDE